MTMVLLPLAVTLVAAGFLLYRRAATAERRCPNCHATYEVIAAAGSGPNTTYDVLACPMCSNTSTRVQGTRSEQAWCPSCRNRSLETPSLRLPGDGVRVEVREYCGICEFERSYVVGEGDVRPLGKVIPFPFERTRRPATEAPRSETNTGG